MATIKIYENEADLACLCDRWSALFAANPDYRIFQSYEWNINGWKYYHSKRYPEDSLFVVEAYREGHEEYAIFPFVISNKGVLSFLMQSVSDVVDAVYKKHDSCWHTFYADVLHALVKTGRVTGFNLSKIEASSEILLYWGVWAEDVVVRRIDSYSTLSLKKSCSLDASLTSLSSKERSYVRSLIKKHHHLEFKIFSRDAGDVYPAREILALRKKMLTYGLRRDASIPLEMFDFIQTIYEAGLCEVSVALMDGVFVEISFRLMRSQQINFWVVLYEKSQLVTVVDAFYMDHKLKSGDFVFDFGTGAYTYKLGTFRPRVGHLYGIFTHKQTLLTLMKDMIVLAKAYIKRKLIGS